MEFKVINWPLSYKYPYGIISSRLALSYVIVVFMLQFKNDEDLFPADSTDFVHNDFVAAWKVRNLWNVFIFFY